MLIIGHRGAAGIKPENTLASLRAGMDAGADMIEFDIRMTKDNVPVLSHDFHLYRTHRSAALISTMTLKELRKRTAGSDQQFVTLEQALRECFGKTLLNIELKPGTPAELVLPVLKTFITRKRDWKLVLFSSRKPKVLASIRKHAPHAQLALYHHLNPFVFLRYAAPLRLSAVGFHRLNTNKLAVEIARRLQLFTYAYTVNRPEAALRLAQQGIDGIVTDRPDLLLNDRKIKALRT